MAAKIHSMMEAPRVEKCSPDERRLRRDIRGGTWRGDADPDFALTRSSGLRILTSSLQGEVWSLPLGRLSLRHHRRVRRRGFLAGRQRREVAAVCQEGYAAADRERADRDGERGLDRMGADQMG